MTDQDNQQGDNQMGGQGTPVPPPTGGVPVPPVQQPPMQPPTDATPVPPVQQPPMQPPTDATPVPPVPPVQQPPVQQMPVQQPPVQQMPPVFPPAQQTGGIPAPPTGGSQFFPPAGGAPIPPPPPEDTTPANFQLGAKLPQQLKIKVPANELQFDGDYFIRLLAGSISLSKDEKKKIIESIPKLKQEQIDELVRIFEEEKQKFAALSQKHVPQLEKLADQHYNEWMDLEAEQQQEGKKEEDQSKADEIRKNLGL